MTSKEYRKRLNAGKGDTLVVRPSELPRRINLWGGFTLVELDEGEVVAEGDFWYHLGHWKRLTYTPKTEYLRRPKRYGKNWHGGRIWRCHAFRR